MALPSAVLCRQGGATPLLSSYGNLHVAACAAVGNQTETLPLHKFSREGGAFALRPPSPVGGGGGGAFFGPEGGGPVIAPT